MPDYKRILGFDVSYEDGPSGEDLLLSLVSTFVWKIAAALQH